MFAPSLDVSCFCLAVLYLKLLHCLGGDLMIPMNLGEFCLHLMHLYRVVALLWASHLSCINNSFICNHFIPLSYHNTFPAFSLLLALLLVTGW